MPSLFHSYQTTPEASETSQLRARIMELEAKLQAEQSRSSYWRDAFMRLKSNREKTEAESKNATATVPATKAYDQAEQDRHSFLFPKWTGSFHEHISASDHRVGVFDQDISVSDQDLAQERELELAKPFHRLRETPFTFDLREVQTGKLSRLTAREQDAQSLHTLMRNTPQRVSKERRHEEKSRLLVGAHGRGIREHTHSRRMDAVTAQLETMMSDLPGREVEVQPWEAEREIELEAPDSGGEDSVLSPFPLEAYETMGRGGP